MFRTLSALVLLGLGVVMLVPPLQARLAVAAAPIGQWADRRFGGMSSSGLAGQFTVGLLLGAVWSPCVGPTLGAASVLAAQGRDLAIVALTMMVFGLGAALPLLLLGMLSRQTLLRWRKGLSQAGHDLKVAMGVILIVVSAAILSGLDKSVETVLVAASPDWLSDLTSRF